MYGGQSSYIPMKVNASGVMPIIFASAVITFPSLIMTLCGLNASSGGFASFWFNYLGTGTVINSIVTALLILFFAYFYAQIQFNPSDVSLNIQQHGGFIPGIRPGTPTINYIKDILNKLTWFGAFFLGIIAIIPVLFQLTGLSVSFGGTAVLIVAGVALETVRQLESNMVMRHYKGFLD